MQEEKTVKFLHITEEEKMLFLKAEGGKWFWDSYLVAATTDDGLP